MTCSQSQAGKEKTGQRGDKVPGAQGLSRVWGQPPRLESQGGGLQSPRGAQPCHVTRRYPLHRLVWG